MTPANMDVLDLRSAVRALGGMDRPTGAAGSAEAVERASLEQQLADTSRLLEITSKRLLEQQRQFEEVIHSLQQQAERDALTGLFNRRKFNAVFANEMQRHKRYGAPLSLIMLDIDRFKCVNDNHGHLVGDEVLVEFAQLLEGRMRDADTVARWGGEEFMVLAPHTELAQALVLAEQLRAVVQNHTFANVGEVTCCLGVTQQGADDTTDKLIHRADAALYHAKHNGRNRVESFAVNWSGSDCC